MYLCGFEKNMLRLASHKVWVNIRLFIKDNTEMKYADTTEKIIRCAMKVHNTLGNGFREVFTNVLWK